MLFSMLLSVLLFSSCSENNVTGSDDPTPEPTVMTKFSSGNPTPNNSPLLFGPQKTAMDRGGNHYWTDNDHIWVKNGSSYVKDVKNTILGTQEVADFWLPGSMTASEYTVFYTGQNSPEASSSSASTLRVTITSTQRQSIPNNGEHFGQSGDCGTATAERSGDSYSFRLNHRACYLVFAPKSANVETAGNCKLKKITVTSDKNICGTYDFTTGHLNTSTVTSAGKTITLEVGEDYDGMKGQEFPIPTTQDVAVNGAFMVIQPGTHALTITYTVEYYGVTQDYVKTIASREFDENKYYTVGHSLAIEAPEHVFYFPDTYYMWDAKQWYWYGEESYPTKHNDQNSFYPRSQGEDPLRWYNTATSGNAANSCKDMPNANELSWYVKYGDPYYDGTTVWSLGGIKQRGGLWLKKKAVILADNPSVSNLFSTTVGCDGKNWVTTASSVSVTPKTGVPGNKNNYFFLPNLGYYYMGELDDVGSRGWYWSSSRAPSNGSNAYSLMVYNNYVGVSSGDHYWSSGYSSPSMRVIGFVGGKRHDGSAWFK